jgi:hypothetical protein
MIPLYDLSVSPWLDLWPVVRHRGFNRRKLLIAQPEWVNIRLPPRIASIKPDDSGQSVMGFQP